MRVAERLRTAVRGGGLEVRPQQDALAAAVASTLEEGGVLLAEAGTGVGKSFAYLLPALDRALRTGRTVAVSTHTLHLQEQLHRKDLPVVARALAAEGAPAAKTVLLKGRGNYLSRRRLKLALEGGLQGAFWNEGDALARLAEWEPDAVEGTRGEVPFPIRAETWREVQSDPYHCLGGRCPTFLSCFFHSKRRDAQNAHLLLVNHALLLSDLALRLEEKSGILPELDALVIDEAHHLPVLAAEHLAGRTALSDFLALGRRLLSPNPSGEGGGLFAVVPVTGAGEAVAAYRAEAEQIFLRISEGLEFGGGRSRGGSRLLRLPASAPPLDALEAASERLCAKLEAAARVAPTEELRLEAEGHCQEVRDLLRRLSLVLERGLETDASYVAEVDSAAAARGEIRAAAVKAVPLSPADLLRESLFASTRACVLTSATLSVGGDFSYLRRQLGLDESEGAFRVREISVGSPFDYARQVELRLPRRMPHPRREEEAYLRAVIDHVRASVMESRGRAFVLFTSYHMLREVAEALRGDFERAGYPLYAQGEEGWDRTRLLEAFREEVHSVLFGVASFWEGVDVPGESLSNLIVAKLPFASPDDPVLEDRHERLRREGRNPFREESLPEAALKLRQGFGRLIRSSTDRGTVTILDPRITTEWWGRVFLEALPPCRTVFLARRAYPKGGPLFLSKRVLPAGLGRAGANPVEPSGGGGVC